MLARRLFRDIGDIGTVHCCWSALPLAAVPEDAGSVLPRTLIAGLREGCVHGQPPQFLVRPCLQLPYTVRGQAELVANRLQVLLGAVNPEPGAQDPGLPGRQVCE
jgi:hypothetical protein